MHRILLFAGTPFQLYTYGAMLSVAIFVASALFMPRARRIGLSDDHAMEFIGIFILAAVAGGRIMHIGLEWPYYQHHPLQMLNLREGGLALYGALVGGTLTLFGYAYWRKLALFDLLDAAAPACILAQGIGRIGCFFNGCCYGKFAPPPWGVYFKDAEPAVAAIPRYPTQLYEFAADVALCLLLLWWTRRRHRRGEIFFVYLMFYAVIRFGLEFLRDEPIVAMGLTFAQWCGIVFFIFALGGLAWIRRQGERIEGLVLREPPSLPAPAAT